jgi:hypothetical protein
LEPIETRPVCFAISFLASEQQSSHNKLLFQYKKLNNNNNNNNQCASDLQVFQKPRRIALGLSGYPYPKLVPKSH